MRLGGIRTRWPVAALLVLAAGPAVGAVVYILPLLAWDLARALWIALPVALAAAGWVFLWFFFHDWDARPSIPTLLCGRAARGEASPRRLRLLDTLWRPFGRGGRGGTPSLRSAASPALGQEARDLGPDDPEGDDDAEQRRADRGLEER